MRIIKYLPACLFLFFLSFSFASASSNKEIIIFHADGLNVTMREIEKAFLRQHPDLRLIRESSGSRLAAKKITELDRFADILMVADSGIIEELKKKGLARWYIKFLKDEIVIAYTDKSRYTNEINKDNWHKILLKGSVSYGYANPKLDPCGYRTLLVWKLADTYYHQDLSSRLKDSCPPNNIRPDAAALLPLLESLALDYAFLYGSVARQHNLKYISLPEMINLSQEQLESVYAKASIELERGKTRVSGSPIIFALTIPENAQNRAGAIEFLKFLFSRDGRKISEENYQPQLIKNIAVDAEYLPAELKEFVSLQALR